MVKTFNERLAQLRANPTYNPSDLRGVLHTFQGITRKKADEKFPDKPETFQILVEGKLHEAKELLYLLNNPVNDLTWVNLKIGQAVPHTVYYHEAYTDKHSGDTLYTVSFFATLSPGLPQKHTLALVVNKDRILKEFLVNIDQLDMDIPFEKELRYYL